MATPNSTARHLRPVHEPSREPVHDPGAPDPGPTRQIRLTPVTAIQLRPTYWLWDGRIPQGALTLGPGREGIGKSLFCAWLAAQVTRGRLPGVHYGRPQGVIYAATEDSWERTIAGRLHTAEADLSRVYRVEVDYIGATVPLSLPRDCDSMAAEITANGVALLILDPLISAVDSRIDVNGESLRDALEPLAALADQTGCAIFGLAHFNKANGTDVLSRITGSRAFSAVSRAVIAFARDPDADDGSCVISQVKNNLGRLDVPSLRYVVDSVTLDTPTGPGEWGQMRMLGETDAHVEDILNDTGKRRPQHDKHESWLMDYLMEHGGSAPANDIYAAAESTGYSKDQVKRAKVRLKNDGLLTSSKDTGWSWKLVGIDSEGATS